MFNETQYHNMKSIETIAQPLVHCTSNLIQENKKEYSSMANYQHIIRVDKTMNK